MSPEQSIWLMSMLGTVLFIAVGFFGARAAQVREVPRGPSRDRGDLDRAHSQLRTTLEEREQLRAQLAAVQSDLEEAVRAGSEWKKKAQKPPEVVREVVRDVVEKDDPRVPGLQARIGELEDEKAKLRLVLEDAERRAEESAAARELEQQTADLNLELASARTKIAEMDRLREENTRLRAAAAESVQLRSDLQRLEVERTQLKARAFAVDKVKDLPPAPSSPGAFEKIVREVAAATSVRAVAIADELGFTIAGVGSEQEGLAALSGLLGEIERRAQLLLPVGSVRRITLEMDHGAGVSVCPIAKSDTRISLATLTVGPRPDTASLAGAIEKAGELLFR